jgi:hypothetical protein
MASAVAQPLVPSPTINPPPSPVIPSVEANPEGRAYAGCECPICGSNAITTVENPRKLFSRTQRLEPQVAHMQETLSQQTSQLGDVEERVAGLETKSPNFIQRIYQLEKVIEEQQILNDMIRGRLMYRPHRHGPGYGHHPGPEYDNRGANDFLRGSLFEDDEGMRLALDNLPVSTRRWHGMGSTKEKAIVIGDCEDEASRRTRSMSVKISEGCDGEDGEELERVVLKEDEHVCSRHTELSNDEAAESTTGRKRKASPEEGTEEVQVIDSEKDYGGALRAKRARRSSGKAAIDKASNATKTGEARQRKRSLKRPGSCSRRHERPTSA